MTFSGKSLPTGDFSFWTDSGKREGVTQRVSRLWILGCWKKFPSTYSQNPSWCSWMSFEVFLHGKTSKYFRWDEIFTIKLCQHLLYPQQPSERCPPLLSLSSATRGGREIRLLSARGHWEVRTTTPPCQHPPPGGPWDYPKSVILYYLSITEFQSSAFSHIHIKFIVGSIILHVSNLLLW